MSWQTGIIVHGIGQPRRALEAGEQPYWISREQFIDLVDRIAALPDPESVRITFDDGNLSDLDIALPELEKRGLKGEFYVLTGRIGEEGSLGGHDIECLLAAGMIVGSHGIAHRNWSLLSQSELETEISQSKSELEALCGQAIDFSAIPFGAYNGRVLRSLRNAGYTRAYSSDRGRMNPGRFLCPRGSVRGDMSGQDFDALISGHLSPTQQLRRAFAMASKKI